MYYGVSLGTRVQLGTPNKLCVIQLSLKRINNSISTSSKDTEV